MSRRGTHGRTWPTPSKSELFGSRSDRNVVKQSYAEVDEHLCSPSAATQSSLSVSVDASVGEQSLA